MTNLHQAIAEKSAKVGVVGLGYVGLPLVRAFHTAGFRTIGFDIDPAKIEQLAAGRSYIKHIPADWVGGWIASGASKPLSICAGWPRPIAS